MGWGEKLGRYLSEALAEQGVIGSDDVELYAYGLNVGIDTTIGFLLCFLFGCVFHRPFESVLYSVIFFIIRTRAGGFHFTSSMICFWFSMILDLFAIYMIGPLASNLNNWIMIATLIGSFICIWVLSPVETPNKPLDEKEKKVYGKQAKFMWLIATILVLILFSLGIRTFAAAGLLAILLVSVLVIAGAIANMREKKSS
jgi:Membrane protein putatively involved in post-translational modification of the autoinducing quorum-sensing peptide